MRLARPLVVAALAAVLLAGGPRVAGAQGAPPPEAPVVAPPGPEVPVEGEAPPEEPPPPQPVPDPSPRIRVLLAGEALARAEAARAVVAGTRDAARADEDQARLGAHAAAVAVAATGAELAQARHQLQDAAVSSFIWSTGGATPATRDLTLYEQRRGHQLTSTVVEHRIEVLARARQALAGAEGRLDERARGVAAAAEALAARQADLDRADEEVARAAAELATARAQDVPRLFDAADPGRWELAILGESTFTADELAAFAAQRGAGALAAVPAAELARTYVEEGATEGVRGDVAFAQAVLETGWFTNDDTVRFHNYAGIGHCDTCPTGFAFASPRDGVRAQVQLLKGYVERQPQYRNPLVDPRLRGPAGCCQTWDDLTGVWATSTTYGGVVLGVYLEMLDWLTAHRAGAAPPV